jgi:hypothetical protein
MNNEEILTKAEEIKTQKIWDKVAELREEGKLPVITQEDLENEPTALANSQYREQENIVSETPENEVEPVIEQPIEVDTTPIQEPVTEESDEKKNLN